MGRKKTAKKKPSTLAEIKAEYITGEISLRELAKKHNISESKLFRHSKKESWRKKREEYRSEVTAEAIACAGTRAINDFAELLDIGKTLAGEIRLALGDPKQLYRRIVADSNGNPVEREFSKLDTKAVKDLSGAVEKLAAVIGKIEKPNEGVEIVMDESLEEYAI